MILLTGAAGYIGSHLALKLLKYNIPFIGIDNFSTKNKFNNRAILESTPHIL